MRCMIAHTPSILPLNTPFQHTLLYQHSPASDYSTSPLNIPLFSLPDTHTPPPLIPPPNTITYSHTSPPSPTLPPPFPSHSLPLLTPFTPHPPPTPHPLSGLMEQSRW